MLGIYLTIALVLHLGFDHPVLKAAAFIFYALAGLAMIIALTKLKKDVWIYVKKRDGGSLFGVRERGLQKIRREDLVREILRYANSANQLAEATPVEPAENREP